MFVRIFKNTFGDISSMSFSAKTDVTSVSNNFWMQRHLQFKKWCTHFKMHKFAFRVTPSIMMNSSVSWYLSAHFCDCFV